MVVVVIVVVVVVDFVVVVVLVVVEEVVFIDCEVLDLKSFCETEYHLIISINFLKTYL